MTISYLTKSCLMICFDKITDVFAVVDELIKILTKLYNLSNVLGLCKNPK